MKYTLLLFIFVLVGVAHAQSGTVEDDPRSAFRSVQSVEVPDILVPTVVSVPVNERLYLDDYVLVEEQGSGNFIGSRHIQQTTKSNPAVEARTIPPQSDSYKLVDNKRETQFDFAVDGEQVSNSVVILSSTAGVTMTANRLHTALAPHVTLPLTIAIKARVNGEMRTVVTATPMNSETVSFPETTADYWEIMFSHIQPLQITELDLLPAMDQSFASTELRFLAQPGSSYRVYTNADRSVQVRTTESGNLLNNDGVVNIVILPPETNQLYVPADIDRDGVKDIIDNCVSQVNPEQEDINSNGKGDACEDFDRDGIMNHSDNCPSEPNRNQADEDEDGIGDVCDSEESRLTERYIWVPWVGMGVAASVLIVLFLVVGVRPKSDSLPEMPDNLS